MGAARNRRSRAEANYGPEIGTTYLLHFDRPYQHAQHYIGWSQNLAVRLDAHLRGRGARLVEVARKAGIGFTLARTWPETTKDREDLLKHRGSARRFCPECGVTPAQGPAVVMPPRRLTLREMERLGTWSDGTPLPEITEYPCPPVTAPDQAAHREEPEMFGSKARAERRQQAEADRLFALADQLALQAGERPNYQREITAERAARIRARLGEDLAQDARLEAMPRAEGQPLEHWAITPDDVAQAGREPVLQGAELDAEIDRLAEKFAGADFEPDEAAYRAAAELQAAEVARAPADPEQIAAWRAEFAAGRVPDERDDASRQEVAAWDEWAEEQGEREAAEDRAEARARREVEAWAEHAEALRQWREARVLGQQHIAQGVHDGAGAVAEQLAAPQPDLSAEEIQAFEQAERERWAQVDRDTEYMARQAAQYYGPEIADLLGIEPGDAVQAPGPEPGDDAATWSPALEDAEPALAAEDRLAGDLEDLAGDAELSRRQERAALARERLALEAQAQYRAAVAPELVALATGEGAVAAAARQTAAQMRESRREAEADAYGVAADLQDTAGWAAADEPEREPMERMPAEAGHSPALAPVAAAQPAGTAHADPALAERGWQAGHHGVYVRSPAAEALGPHREVAGYEAGTPDHLYGAPECEEADSETAHFGHGPGEPQDAGQPPVQPAAQHEAGPYGTYGHQMDVPLMLAGLREADAADAQRLAGQYQAEAG